MSTAILPPITGKGGRSPRHVFFLIAAAMLLVLAGCGTYQLGTGTEIGFQTLYVEPVRNEAGLPQAAALYSKELREAFIRDGRIALASSPAEADAVLEIVLHDTDREPTSALPEDTRLARKLDLSVTARATLRDQKTGRELFKDRELTAVRQLFTTSRPTGEVSSQQQAEYNTHPLVARQLAEQTLHLVLDTW